MQTRFYEVNIRFTPPFEDDEVDFSYFFQCHPTQRDVLLAVQKNIDEYSYCQDIETAVGRMHSLYLFSRNVVMDLRGEWFYVGTNGGRISNAHLGFVSVLDHIAIDNNAAIG